MMALRMYLILRLLRDFSPAYSKRFLIGKDYGRENNIKVSKIDTGSVLKVGHVQSEERCVAALLTICHIDLLLLVHKLYFGSSPVHCGRLLCLRNVYIGKVIPNDCNQLMIEESFG